MQIRFLNGSNFSVNVVILMSTIQERIATT